MIDHPLRVEIIGDFLAIKWEDTEIILDSLTLRQNSPSAEQKGESDIFGNLSGGANPKNFSGVRLLSYTEIGNYALRLLFSDGHGSGIYSWDLLRKLGETVEDQL